MGRSGRVLECEPGTLTEKKVGNSGLWGDPPQPRNRKFFGSYPQNQWSCHTAPDEVFRAFQWARDAGIENINIDCDLIAGMLEERDDNWSDCIQKVIQLNPEDCVTIYQMEVPFNTTIYKSSERRGGNCPPPLRIGRPKDDGLQSLQ